MNNSVPGESIDITVGLEEAGDRFDHVIAARIPGCSRTRAARLIRSGLLRIGNDSLKKPGYRIAPGDRITGCLPPLEPPSFSPENIEIDVVYLDNAIIIINKPPGLVVHPAPGHMGGTLSHGLIFRFPELDGVGPSPERPGIIHRIDKDTSGILVVARTPSAYRHLKSEFQARTVEKTYLAFVYGKPKESRGRITLPISRHPVHRKKMCAGGKDGARHAETWWKVLHEFEGISLLEFDIKTGRTHQIRVHAASMGHPVIGDETYGFRNPARTFSVPPLITGIIREHVRRQLLHAAKIAFTHPETGQQVLFTAPMPGDMTEFLKKLMELSGSGPTPSSL